MDPHTYRHKKMKPGQLQFIFGLCFFHFIFFKSISYLFISLITLNSLGYQTNYDHFLKRERLKRARNGVKKRAML